MPDRGVGRGVSGALKIANDFQPGECFNMISDPNNLKAQCHCGAVRFEVKLSDGFNSIRRCNCSYCRMRGAAVVAAATDGIRFLQGEDVLTRYRFNTGVAQHFFCSRCGIATHLQRRSSPQHYAVNVACLEGVSPFDFAEVPVTDGIHHPGDTGEPARQAGVMRFIAQDQARASH
ncbi:GFA family protein [Paraburkholderia tropica]|uniref:GFA family protein n=1 Tax=Paraburkholderia tropica TaxID=92647 RepID=UPI001CC416D3|nr:GFA family protein [Paraburkholderia tropica]